MARMPPGIGHETLHLFRRRWQADQVEEQATHQRARFGLWRGAQSRLFELPQQAVG
jgi:hypothetical protein